jgi:hypothetical protein
VDLRGPGLGRTRDYLAIVRRVLAGDAPVTYEGQHLSLPLHDGNGAAPAYTSMVRPLRREPPSSSAPRGQGTLPWPGR